METFNKVITKNMKQKKTSNISILNFATEIKDLFIRTGNKYISWGADNQLPKQYIDLYDTIPEHTSSINFILANLITDGIEDLDYWDLQKLGFDYLLFGGFTIKVIKLRNGESKLEYIDISKLRYNPSKDSLGFSEDWGKAKAEVEWFDIVENILEDGIYIFNNPKTRDLYPKPHYHSVSKSLDTMRLISEYHNNNAANGFSPSVVINFNNGEPDDETKKELEAKINEKFTGSNGNKLILSYNESQETKTTIDKLDGDNLDEKFETLQKFIQNQIIIAHQITSGQLIGVKPENTGFSKTEYDEALDIFKTIIVAGFRREIEYGLTLLLDKEITLNIGGEINE